MNRKLYLHKQSQDEVELIDVEESITVVELIKQHGEADDAAWVQDGDELIVTAPVIEVVEERGHIHIGPRREVDVTVRYLGEDKAKDYLPATRLRTVLTWATGEHGFNVPESQRSDMGLYFRDSEEPLDKSEHVGALDGPDHKLHLKMQPVRRHNG